ncbi:HNH endonuclease [Mesobacillus maritimus]
MSYHQNTGVLQVVNRQIHSKTGHTGGRAIWGTL